MPVKKQPPSKADQAKAKELMLQQNKKKALADEQERYARARKERMAKGLPDKKEKGDPRYFKGGKYAVESMTPDERIAKAKTKRAEATQDSLKAIKLDKSSSKYAQKDNPENRMPMSQRPLPNPKMEFNWKKGTVRRK